MSNVAPRRPIYQDSDPLLSGKPGGPGVVAPSASWIFDLEDEWPIHVIRLQNRLSRSAIPNAGITVAISMDQQHWHLVQAGARELEQETASGPLEIPLLERVRARYVRLELPHLDRKCPCRVEVLVRRRRATLTERVRHMNRARIQRNKHVPLRYEAPFVDVALNGVGSQGFVGESVDLQSEWPIYRIRIHGHPDQASTSTARLIVLISRDGVGWEPVHDGTHAGGEIPLDIYLLSARIARFIRLAMPGQSPCELSKIQVLVERRLADLRVACARHGFVYDEMLSTGNNRHRYAINHAPVPYDGKIDALHITHITGRFGNNVRTIANVACLARRLGVSRVYIPHFSQLEIKGSLRADGVTLKHDSKLARDRPAAVLTGSFFYPGCFGDQLKDLSAEEFDWAIRNFVRPIFDRKACQPRFMPAKADLAIHIRSGDLFTKLQPHPGYVQPPLSFYQLIIGFAARELKIERVILVYEDDLNPCVNALMQWLGATSFPFVTQSASLAEDIAILRHARHCVFGHGTFGPGIVLLSDTMETVFFPGTVRSAVATARSVGVRPIQVHDVAGQYTKAGTWRGSPEQRKLMLDYPLENLALDEDPKAAPGPHEIDADVD